MKKASWQLFLRLLPYLILLVAGLVVSLVYGTATHGSIGHRLASSLGVILFVITAIVFIHLLGNGIRKNLSSQRLGEGRAAALQFIIRTVGYIVILIIALGRIGIPVEHILLGSAILGIILGVAAQQALANIFASIVLIIDHPYTVGQRITLVSGSLGGKYEGKVDDIGLIHTRLRLDDGNIVKLPNSTILIGGAITVHKNEITAKADG